MSDPNPGARRLFDHHFNASELATVLGTDDDRALAVARTATGAPLADVISRPGKALRARFVERAFEIARDAGGDADAALPPDLPHLVELLHCGSLIVDDVEDDAILRRGGPALHRIVGVARAINGGNLLYFLPLRSLAQIELAPALRLAMIDRITDGLIRCHHGQGIDLAVRVGDLRQCEVAPIVELSTTLKTGALLELSCALGAIAAHAPPSLETALADFGREAGVALQMLDDLSGVFVPSRKNKAIEDLVAQRPTWAWAWLASEVDAEKYAELSAMLAPIAATPSRADPLLEAMRVALEPMRRRPRARLDEALRALRTIVGEVPSFEALSRDLRAMERGYA
jgi:geranylgeranyl pyrophosphate synthase